MDKFFKREINFGEEAAFQLTAFQIYARDKEKDIEMFGQPKKKAEKRPVGRPKHHPVINIDEILIDDDAPSEPTHIDSVVKRTRIDWFSSPLIHDIIAARKTFPTAYETVEYLKKKFPKLPTEDQPRFQSLNYTTVDCWFDKDKNVLPKYASKIDQPAPHQGGRPTAFSLFPEFEETLKSSLQKMRDAGLAIKIRTVKYILAASCKKFIQDRLDLVLDPQETARKSAIPRFLKFSSKSPFISRWLRTQMGWTVRVGTHQASKLPEDWENRGREFVSRIAALVKQFNIHPSLIINYDQTGLHLVPKSNRTYDKKNKTDIHLIGKDDKRQITALIGSSYSGDMLPLQLIYEGKTDAWSKNNSKIGLWINFIFI